MYNNVMSLKYIPFYHTGANILCFEFDPLPPKNINGRHFVGVTFSKLIPIFLLLLPLFHVHPKFQVSAVARSAQYRTKQKLYNF